MRSEPPLQGGHRDRHHLETGRRQPETFRARSITSSLTVNDLERSIRFYTEGLGFIIDERWEDNGWLLGVTLNEGTCHLAPAPGAEARRESGRKMRRQGLEPRTY